MLRSKTFLKKTKRGTILKIVREHYLRDDICCGFEECSACSNRPTTGVVRLSVNPTLTSQLCPFPHYIVPDTNVVLHQIDVLEADAISNVILLQTVLEEVRHRSAPVYKRVRDCCNNPNRHFFTFVNEFHKETYVERLPGESANDRNDRAIRTASSWYQSHLSQQGQTVNKIVLLTNDNANRNKAIDDGIIAFTVHDYVASLAGCSELLDKLSSPNADMEVDETSKSRDSILYPTHQPLSEIQRGLKSGRLIQGTFHASRDNYLEAFVNVRDSDDQVGDCCRPAFIISEKPRDERQHVFLQGRDNLNRAVNEDIVAVKILPEDEWSCPSSLIVEDLGEKPDDDPGTEDKLVKPNVVPKSCRIRTGRIVGIVKRNWRQYCGIIQKSVLKTSTRHLFVPAERRIPKIRIETQQANTLEGQRIVVAIDSWPRTSRYPQGHFVRKLGEIGDKDTENEVLLLEHDIPHATFSDAVLACLPQLPWIITPDDIAKRLDLRGVCICSVDPPGCTDIDDALHCRVLPNNNYEVGVHIADVSHFIRPGTAIDREAANRGTTVYLIDKRIDMVPELLSSNLCSLRGGVERFAFSVLWEMTRQADVVSVKYTKSIIKSSAALTYAEAQMKIDDPTLNDDVTLGLRRLNELAKILKRRRQENGALTLASPEIRFHIDSETHDPIDVQTKELRDTNSMVEEFMLLANIYTAQKIVDEFPLCAVLRRHPAPPASNFEPLIKVAESRGFKVDVSCGKLFSESLDSAVLAENPYFNTMLRILATRCMMQAVYFCSGVLPLDQYFHYGLATPIYTHFTSPIRRYSDVMVHRLLAVAIGADASYPELLNKMKSEAVCQNLNFRHRMAQYAGRASVALHTQIFFKNRVSDEKGYILSVKKNGLQILIPKYGLEGTVYLSNNNNGTMATNNTTKELFVYNEQDGTQSAGGIVFHVFDPVVVQISIDKSNIQHQKLALKLVEPQIPGFSVATQSVSEPQSMDATNSSSMSSQPRKKTKLTK